jgi:hypothetical protein
MAPYTATGQLALTSRQAAVARSSAAAGSTASSMYSLASGMVKTNLSGGTRFRVKLGFHA